MNFISIIITIICILIILGGIIFLFRDFKNKLKGNGCKKCPYCKNCDLHNNTTEKCNPNFENDKN